MNISTFNHWWLIGLKGLVALIFGITIFRFPIEATETFLLFYAFLIGLGGLFVLVFALINPRRIVKKWFLLEGVVDIGIATLIFLYPDRSANFIVIMIGFWLLFGAVSQIFSAYRYRLIDGDWKLSVANGLLTLILSIMVILQPISGILVFAYLLGLTMTLYGVFLILTTFRWWRHQKNRS